MRLVLDTNVVASALLWDGVPRRLVQLALQNDASLFSSLPMLEELTGILYRRKFEKKIAASLLSIDQLVNLYAGIAALVRPIPVAGLARDPDDDVVIGTALAAKADFLVTGDLALLSVAEYEGGRIVSVREALQAVSQK
jgi:putative PIN family toxin of toxin-antitoxin system